MTRPESDNPQNAVVTRLNIGHSLTNAVIAVTAVLLVDTLGGLVSRHLSFSFAYVALCIYAAYLVVGWVGSWPLGVLTACLMALSHATIGFTIVAQLGPTSVGHAFLEKSSLDLLLNGLVSAVLAGLLATPPALLRHSIRRRG